MSAECRRCGWDLPFQGDCVVCDERDTFKAQLAEAHKLMRAARKNHVCKCSDCAAIDAILGESG